MSDEIEQKNTELEDGGDRRDFLKKCGKGAVVGATVPAVTLLLSANAKPAKAADAYNGDPDPDPECGCGSIL